jgi:Sap, sulfolipid-1-addressing protein
LGQVLVFALTAALNPTLVAASTLMMLMDRPVRLMLGYLLGALLTSITLGILIVYELKSSGVLSTTKHSLGPGATTAIGVLFLILALVLRTGRDERVAERRRARKAAKPDKGPSLWQRQLGKGSARITFVVGALLTLPGASYIAGLTSLSKLHYSKAETVFTIILFNIIMLALLEVPLLCFAIAPNWTPNAIARAKAWAGRHWRRFFTRFFTVIGVLMVIKGVLQLIS